MPDCVICLDSLGEDISSTNCGHVLHTKCLRRSMRVRRECPICRQTVLGIFKIFINLDPSQSQRPPPVDTQQLERTPLITPSSPLVPSQRRANPQRSARTVVELLSDSDGPDVTVMPSSDTTTDEDYPDLDNMQYSDIEPDVNEVDALQDALAHAMVELEAARRDSVMRQQAFAQVSEQRNKLLTTFRDLNAELQAKDEEILVLQSQLEKSKSRLSLESGRVDSLKREIEQLRAENNSLMMRKVASDIERILSDLTLEQAIRFGSDINALSRDEIASRMAGLTKISKEDRLRAQGLEEQLIVKKRECEQLQRSVKNLDENALRLQRQLEYEREHFIVESNAPEPVKQAPIINPPTSIPFKPSPMPRPPPKFSTGVKRSFDVPDGTGGTTKRSFLR